MAKSLYIAEKPSVAQEFMKALGENPVQTRRIFGICRCGFTWCVGHLVEMVYPEVYDEKYKKWS